MELRMTAAHVNWRKLLEPGVNALGFELVDAELAGRGRRAVLRVYIDAPGGVTIDDCADVSAQLSAILDVEDPIAEHYTLEVSSPGLDRPLVRREDFERFTGETVRLRLHQPLDGRRNFQGRLLGLAGDRVRLNAGEETVELELDSIAKAKLVPQL
jgi:ribosome maturation factor RimP